MRMNYLHQVSSSITTFGKRRPFKVALYCTVMFSILFSFSSPVVRAETSSTILPEGRDFATQVLRDPWDMSQYSDVSTFLNGDGYAINLTNINVQNGIFSATSLVADNWFYLLFAGYETALMVGKIGHNYPIQSAIFHCYSMAMTANASGTRKMSVWWAENEHLSNTRWGVSSWYDVAPYWKLYQIDLSTSYDSGVRWTDLPSWQSLYVRPFLQAGVTFSIDWARLTDCNPVYKTINWTGTGPVSIYLRPVGTTREIEIKTGITGNSYNLDVQGVAPGDYTYLVKNNGSLLASSDFTINPAPIGKFEKPSFTSGDDYATLQGKPWNMHDASSIDKIVCATGTFQNDLLDLVTPGPKQEPSGCNANNISDPQVWLNTPALVDSSQYRYLTFSLNTQEPWADVHGGMIARWVWTINNDTCGLVSNDIPFDVGWQTISIDLQNPTYGAVEDRTSQCPQGSLYWNSAPAKRVRLDPNENTLDHALNQQISNIYLTKMDTAHVGFTFPVVIHFNKPASQISSASFYYTNNLSQPTQHPAVRYVSSPQPSSHFFYLPFISGGMSVGIVQDPNTMTFQWNTSGVVPGAYYICGIFNDSFNTVLYCSDAPVNLVP
jgi:hypothetical protein